MSETQIIYNADCPICAHEIGAYRSHAAAAGLPLRFEGLDSPALARHGLTADEAARRLHVVKDGRLLAGIPAFLALWEAMPRFRWLARAVRLPGIRQAAGLVYEGVLAPWLYALHRRRIARNGRVKTTSRNGHL